MRKLKLLVQTSIDGFIAESDGRTDWMVWNWGESWNWDDELQRFFIVLTRSIDCILLSRQMAEEGFVAHWEKAAASDGRQAAFARTITEAKKIVFSSTLKTSVWPNTHIAGPDFVAEINALKSLPGKDIIVYGGATFVSSLISAGVIDECFLFVNPTALGEGLRIFTGKTRLTLVNATPYRCGVVVLRYEPGPAPTPGRTERPTVASG